MLKKIVSAVLLIAFVQGGFALPAPKKTPRESLNRIVAIVNNDVISEKDLDKRDAEVRKRINMSTDSTGAELTKSQLRTSVLNQMIDEKIEQQWIKRIKIKVSAKEVDNTLRAMAKNKNLTLSQLYNAVEQQEGMSKKAFRKVIQEQLELVQLQREAVSSDVKVTKEDLDKAWTQYQADQGNNTLYDVVDMLIELPDTPSAHTVSKALKLSKRMLKALHKGASMQALATQYNTKAMPVSVTALGYRALTDLPDLFSKPLASMHAGMYAGPLRAGNGFHVIQVTNTRSQKGKGMTKSAFEKLLFEKQFQEKWAAWLKRMRAAAYVKLLYHP